MPRDFKEFDMATWLSAYKCGLHVIIKVMKWVASLADDPEQRLKIIRNLVWIWIIYRVISFLAIHPYITVRILYDTLQQRREALKNSLQVSNFRGNNPGLNHKAGVAPGETFVLVYQLPHHIEDLRKIDNERFNLTNSSFISDFQFNLENFQNVIEGMKFKVVADFTLPFICCDECVDVPSMSVTLDPFCPPVASFVQSKSNEDFSYRTVEIQLINDLYEPDVYMASLKTQPNFGITSFRDEPYDPDPAKTKQILIYDVDTAKLAEEMQRTDNFFIIDEFDYQVRDVMRDEIVGSDTITLFIPVTRETEPTTGTVRGSVQDVNGNAIPGANITVQGLQIGTATDTNGNYMLSNVPTGPQTLIASFIGYRTKSQEVEVTAGDNVVNFILGRAEVITINYDRIYVAREIDRDSTDAVKIRKFYSTTMNEAKRKADALLQREGKEEVTPITKAATSVKEFSDEEEISVVRLNNEYNKRRNELINAIKNTEGAEKELHKDALKNVTVAYLNRLAYTQPTELTSTTKGVLNESATIFNAEEELEIKKTVEEWQDKAKGYISEDFENNLKDNFKLK
jgi:hypothetical protein